MVDFLEKLNDAQRKAVEHAEGPSIVIAGAGSGKTRVLTFRIAYLMARGIDPFNILALTFTNKAAREMQERIHSMVGPEAQNLWMGTFHSIFARMLRYDAQKLGYPSNFTIYDADDSKNLLRSIIREMKLDDKVYKANMVYNRISSAKNSLISPEGYMNDPTIQSDDQQSRRPQLGEIYKKYASRCFKAGAMDFDDLLYNTNVLLRDHADVLHRYQDKFRFILVDEFQDTNFSQYTILKKLAARFENITVVGDDAQSIYAFRGANIENILNFQRDYSDTKMFKLEQNYRSTKNIVEAADSIIKKNKQQLEKTLWTNNDAGQKVKVLRALTDNEEGAMVAQQVFEIKNNERLRNVDFAVLYRTNSQSRSIEEALRKLNIPYRVYGGISFYQRKEIKDVLGYCRLAVNPHDEEALKRVINYPARGIGQTTINKITVAASDHDTSLWNILTSLGDFQLGINSGTQTKIGNFITMIESFQAGLDTENAFDLGSRIAKTSGVLKELYDDRTPEGISRYENILELLNAMKEFTDTAKEDKDLQGRLDEFMQDIALLTDADKTDPNDYDRVSLMTVHQAKGLEFPYVFISGMEENLFPSQLSLNSRSDLEEERRLFYVALTRAERRATISYSTSRYRWGQLISCEPSRFIEEIDEKYLDYPSIEVFAPAQEKQQKLYKKRQSARKQLKTGTKVVQPKGVPKNLVKMKDAAGTATSFAGDDTSNLQAGMEVEHQRFGKGKVLNIEGNSPNQKATVFFPDVGQKQLLLKFAKLRIIS